ncbi:MAG: J domain-containing protein [Pseudomonadota bacterium]
MTAMLIITAVIIGALILTGKAKTMTANQWLALAVALLGVNFLRGGSWIIGTAMIGGAAFLSGWRILIPAPEESEKKRKPRNFELDRARSLLGVDDKADRTAINNAWRDRLAEHHPDRGGDEEMARMINRARDILLDELDG